MVKSCGPGALISKPDIENAFRLIPIHPQDHRYLGFTHNGQYYFDMCLPMGCSVSCNIFERFSSSLQWILETQYNVLSAWHLLDHLVFVSEPHSIQPGHSLDSFLSLSKELSHSDLLPLCQ